MAYRLKSPDTSLTKEMRRIARSQLDAALEAVTTETGETLAETIHTARKKVKKTRGLLRLIRPALPAYSTENRALRDAARLLSPLRDRGTLLEAYDALLDRYPDQPRQPFASFRGALTLQHKEIAGDPATFDALEAFGDQIATVRGRIDKWTLKERDAEAIAAGLVKTYDRAGKATARARRKLTEDRLHEWRKRAKYHRYHAQILAPVWPEVMEVRLAQSKRLEDLLGEHRDLSLLSAECRALERPNDMSARATFTGLAERRQAEIMAEAFPLSDRLFGEPGQALAARWTGWYRLWRKGR
ncbi:CHAD domain-containing protein [Pseudooceanicola nanhaiensis]|uniref:CHAD domain-containing protein n=1 Tax=Pseudooceanicola nanhaiensis TaxID=375761 RepID=UPI0035111931